MNRLTASLLLMGCLALTGCDDEPRTINTGPEPQTYHSAVLHLSHTAPRQFISTGSVVSDQRIEISSRLSGYLRQLKVKEGDKVQAGDLLAQMDAADVEGAIRQAQAVVSAALAAQKDAQTDLQRFEQLYQRNSISESDLRKARLRVESTTESLNQAQAELSTALAQRDYTNIRSPFAASVVALNSRAGDLLVPGEPILTLESNAALIFETFVPEQRIGLIEIGAPVQLQLDALSQSLSQPLTGEVIRIVRSGDPVTRSYPVKISLPENPDLMPGMFGRVLFALGQSEHLLLPRSALVERGGLQGVFVVDEADHARFRWLRLGREWPDGVEVTAGLTVQDRVVASPSPRMREGDRIEPLPVTAGE
ncbi:MAG: efflux RND transporter periplasmic adaptor subunit [Pseudomonadota bacterium]|nr:efflux RND transporter periplasmic adaptor subunit [Pseudomonadota bacterium]